MAEPPAPTAEPTVDSSETDDPPPEEVLEEPIIAPEPTEEPLPTEEPTLEPTAEPTLEPAPLLTVTATTDCFADPGYAGLVQLDVLETSVAITDILALLAPGTTAPVKLAGVLPATVAWETALSQWWLDGSEGVDLTVAPVALLVRVQELPGDEIANVAAGGQSTGWYFAELMPPAAVCPLPTPSGEGTPETPSLDEGANSIDAESEPTEEASPAPTETPEQTATPVPQSTPEPTATEPPPASPIAEEPETPTPTVTPTETATADLAAAPEVIASPSPSATPESDPIRIAIRSDDGEARPGKSARYRFRITNTTDESLTIRVTTTDSLEGWISVVYQADGTTKLPKEVRLDAGESIDVVARVIPPVEARPGDEDVTAIDAQPVEPSS